MEPRVVLQLELALVARPDGRGLTTRCRRDLRRERDREPPRRGRRAGNNGLTTGFSTRPGDIVASMPGADAVERARGSFERRAWGDAFAELSAAQREGRLDVEDLERLAVAAYMAGRDEACEA